MLFSAESGLALGFGMLEAVPNKRNKKDPNNYNNLDNAKKNTSEYNTSPSSSSLPFSDSSSSKEASSIVVYRRADVGEYVRGEGALLL